MSGGPIYNITLSSVYDSSRRRQVETYVIDREPQGPLSSLTELQDGRTACDPCMGSLNSERRNIPNRYALRLPDSVRRVYPSSLKTDYVDTYTLPGFLSWMSENGYDTVDMKHVVSLDHGFWIQYSDSSTEEFRSIGGSRSFAAKKKPVNHTGRTKPVAARVAVRIGRRR